MCFSILQYSPSSPSCSACASDSSHMRRRCHVCARRRLKSSGFYFSPRGRRNSCFVGCCKIFFHARSRIGGRAWLSRPSHSALRTSSTRPSPIGNMCSWQQWRGCSTAERGLKPDRYFLASSCTRWWTSCGTSCSAERGAACCPNVIITKPNSLLHDSMQRARSGSVKFLANPPRQKCLAAGVHSGPHRLGHQHSILRLGNRGVRSEEHTSE